MLILNNFYPVGIGENLQKTYESNFYSQNSVIMYVYST